MEALPTINQMYSSINEKNILGAIKKYEKGKEIVPMAKRITKKGSYIDDEIKSKISPGPANKANIQVQWGKNKGIPHKYSDRKTYIQNLQHLVSKQNLPSPNKYSITLPWPKKERKDIHEGEKLNFVSTSEYESDKIPGPGSYIVATHIGNPKLKKYEFTENKSKQPIQEKRPNVETYDPIAEGTFRKIEKKGKLTARVEANTGKKKSEKQNKKVPGPGQYQVINTWKGKQALKNGQKSYMNRLHKGSTPNIYYS